jgi:acyl-CoA reductase-like NAD-dependent aldehyde dehydrogenase
VAPGELAQLTALGPAGPYRARNRQLVEDVTGAPVAELSVVPPLFVARAMSALARAGELPAPQRLAALRRAGEVFAGGAPDGRTVEDYQRVVSRVAGTPLPVVRAATDFIRRAARDVGTAVDSARPAGAVRSWRDPGRADGTAVWTRRGDVFAVLAAGNHPAVHAPWLEALALGYRVAVRPSRREPFTPYRLVSALRQAGFGPDQLVLLPTGHATADRMIAGADLAMVYGGQDVVDRWATSPTVLGQGPGRSKILLTASGDWRRQLDVVVASVSDEGGAACTNATAVYVEGDPTPVAVAIAERLAGLPSLPPEDEKARLPVQPLGAARRIEDHFRAKARGCTVRLGAGGLVDELPDGSAVLRPAVVQVERATAPQTAVELGFPCVWVAPWSPADGVGPLRDTLVLAVSTGDDVLVEALVAEPSIRNVYVNDLWTLRTAPHLPHDGFVGEFLMRTKAVIRR